MTATASEILLLRQSF